MADTRSQELRVKIAAAFLAVYLIWGSTYLAIRYAIETMPPFLMAGTRFFIAGSLLYCWARWRGAAKPDLKHWMVAGMIGTLLLVFGNLGVVVAEQTVPSGLVSLLVAMVPVYVALLDWLRPGGDAPTRRAVVGLVVGLVGISILIGQAAFASTGVNIVGVCSVLAGSLSWSIGSIYLRSARLPESPSLATAMEMLTAGVILILISFGLHEHAHLQLSAITLKSLVAWAYLLTFGSIIGFSAYIWLLTVVSPLRVSTYVYVNPIVAVFLGWSMAGEPVTPHIIVAAAVILLAVWLITTSSKQKTKADQKQSMLSLQDKDDGGTVARACASASEKTLS